MQWTGAFLKELLDIPGDAPLHPERAHRSLQHGSADGAAPPRSLIVRFANYQHKQRVLTKAWSVKNIQHPGRRIYTDHDYSAAAQKKRRERADIEKQLEGKNIRFQTPSPAKLTVHHNVSAKTFNSAWEAAEDRKTPGIKTSISGQGTVPDRLAESLQCPHAGERSRPAARFVMRRCFRETLILRTEK